tara:strand:- start:680 stop:1033 length:354 start_codon:yes stop_codon:yes gene_type:complete
MKLKKSEIIEIIKEVLSEKATMNPAAGEFPVQYPKEFQANKIIGAKSLTKPIRKRDKGGFTAFVKKRNEDVEEGLAGGLAGAALAQGDVLKMAAGGYFGSKVQDYINKKLKKKDNES